MYEKLWKPSRLEELILGFSIASTLGLTQLPYEKIDGNPVPTVIFKGRPSMFHAFLLGLNFSFMGAVTSISMKKRHPKLARCCLLLSLLSASTASGILLRLILSRLYPGFLVSTRKLVGGKFYGSG